MAIALVGLIGFFGTLLLCVIFDKPSKSSIELSKLIREEPEPHPEEEKGFKAAAPAFKKLFSRC